MTDGGKRKYADLTDLELAERLKAAFYCPDRLDEAVCAELEELLAALEERRPRESEPDPEEAWRQFLLDREEELAEPVPGAGEGPRTGRARAVSLLLRGLLAAAAAVVLLTGAAMAAGSLGLLAWVPGWNAPAGKYEPSARETSGESLIPAALARLGITEPLYPARLPEGFVITESHISEEPLVLMEQYVRWDERLSVTITPLEGFRTAAYQMGGEPVQAYRSGQAVHYIFAREGSVTSVCYLGGYVTVISGSIPLEEMKRTIDSLREAAS